MAFHATWVNKGDASIFKTFTEQINLNLYPKLARHKDVGHPCSDFQPKDHDPKSGHGIYEEGSRT